MSTSFPTPKPTSYLVKAGAMSNVVGALGLTAPLTAKMVSSEAIPQATLVTPDCSPRDVAYEDVTPQDAVDKISIVLTKEVLSSSKCDVPPTQAPSLVPRPGTCSLVWDVLFTFAYAHQIHHFKYSVALFSLSPSTRNNSKDWQVGRSSTFDSGYPSAEQILVSVPGNEWAASKQVC